MSGIFLPDKAYITVYSCSEFFVSAPTEIFLQCWFTRFYVALSCSIYDTAMQLVVFEFVDSNVICLVFFALLEMNTDMLALSKILY